MTDRTISPFETHEHTVQIASPIAHMISISHEDCDLRLKVQKDGNPDLSHIDIPGRSVGVEYFVAEDPGRYRVTVINSIGEGNGSYSLRVVPIDEHEVAARSLSSAATSFHEDAQTKKRMLLDAIAAWKALSNDEEQARLAYALGSHFRAIDKLEEAVSNYRLAAELEASVGQQRISMLSRYAMAETLTWQDRLLVARDEFLRLSEEAKTVDDYSLVGASLNYVALTYLVQGDLDEARSRYNALEVFLMQHGLNHQLATVYHNLGGTSLEGGDPLAALDYFERSIALDQQTNPGTSVAETLEEIGGIYAVIGRCDMAFRYLQQALNDIAQAGANAESGSGNRARGRIVNRIGNCYRDLGDLDNAMAFYLQALALRRDAGDQRGVAYTLENIGTISRKRGELKKALQIHQESLASHQDRGDSIGEVSALIAIGKDQLSLGEYNTALLTGMRSLERAVSKGFRGYAGKARLIAASAYSGLGDFENAIANYNLALDIFRETNSNVDELEVLTSEAELYFSVGDKARAQMLSTQALNLVELVRSGIGNAELRARFVAAIQSLYLLQLDLLLTVATEDEDLAQALKLNDRRRARVFREQLALGFSTMSSAMDSNTENRYRSLQAGLSVKLMKHQKAVYQGETALAEALADEINFTRIELLTIDAEVASNTSNWQSVVQHSGPDVGSLQSRLDSTTVVVDLAFTARSTHAWMLTDSGLRYERFDAVGSSVSRTELLTAIFTRVSTEFPGRDKLVIIPDGFAYNVQFAGLPLEGDSYLVDRFHIALSPSITLIGNPRISRIEDAKLSLIGEPVFQKEQYLAPEDYTGVALERAIRGAHLDSLSPLPYSGVELQGISEIAKGNTIDLYRGFEATKASIAGGALAGSDIVHFATHGFVNADAPELSGIVLSLVDTDGSAIDGFLSIDDVYGLRGLSASLVVLSGCKTALGERVRGEGPMSLARAFLQLGVKHVVASQWDVPDRATSELMISFYRELLLNRRSPIESLALAQRQLKSNRNWRDPIYWAGFTLWSANSENACVSNC
ncbi:MAG: CHAT domain-containing tetratricopeptide repeat protein [Pseudomonadota bacterium]